MRVSFSPHPHQCFLSLVFVTIAILTGVRWHLIVVLICISPVISYVDYLFLCWPSVCFHMCCFIPCSQQVFVIGTLVCAKSLQLYPTVCNPMDCSLLGSFVHGILQVILGGLPCPPPGLLPDPEIEPMSLSSPALVDGFFTTSHLGRPISTLSIPIFQVRKLRHREMKWGAQGHTAGWQ